MSKTVARHRLIRPARRIDWSADPWASARNLGRWTARYGSDLATAVGSFVITICLMGGVAELFGGLW